MTDERPCLVSVHINPELRVKVARGAAEAHLVAGEWREFLVNVHNEAGTTAELCASSVPEQAWLDLELVHPAVGRTLSGAQIEYRTIRLRMRAAGHREASLAFDVGQGTQDLGFRNEIPILFRCGSTP